MMTHNNTLHKHANKSSSIDETSHLYENIIFESMIDYLSRFETCPFEHRCITDSSICGFLEYRDGKYHCNLLDVNIPEEMIKDDC